MEGSVRDLRACSVLQNCSRTGAGSARPARGTHRRGEGERRLHPRALDGPDARLGLHQDAEEPAEAPVVTISLGDACIFRFAGLERRTAPFMDVELRSGDLLVFGGAIRRIYHGVRKLWPDTAPTGLGLPRGG